MRDLTKHQVKSYLAVGEIAYADSTEFKWMKEYKRFISKSIKPDTDTTTTSSKNFNVNADYEQEKEREWWIRQKYKLMKALMRKWRESEEAKLEKVESTKDRTKSEDYSKIVPNFALDKISMAAKDIPGASEVKIDGSGTVYTKNIKTGEKSVKYRSRTIATNTGPDLLTMLDELKQDVIPKVTKTNDAEDKYADLKVIRRKNQSTEVEIDDEDKYNMKERRKRNIERRSTMSMKDFSVGSPSKNKLKQSQILNLNQEESVSQRSNGNEKYIKDIQLKKHLSSNSNRGLNADFNTISGNIIVNLNILDNDPIKIESNEINHISSTILPRINSRESFDPYGNVDVGSRYNVRKSMHKRNATQHSSKINILDNSEEKNKKYA